MLLYHAWQGGRRDGEVSGQTKAGAAWLHPEVEEGSEVNGGGINGGG